MIINVLDIVKSNLATNLEDGVALFEVIKEKKPSEITISFVGVKLISTLFLNESIGRYSAMNSKTIQELQFEYPEGKEIFAHKIDDVIENALLGEDYDSLVDNALLSM
ncbi:STAS-like domain-containing protein [Flagellimonas sp.]|uniref:STAS-like domain-containing protein n=1 Tax=Flagellimonas sp. TaxID=2058762 RepID=UPI003AB7BD0A